MFFINDNALGKNEGFEVGVGSSVVAMDEGMARSATTTLKDDIYAFIFGQKGLMARRADPRADARRLRARAGSGGLRIGISNAIGNRHSLAQDPPRQ